MPSPVRRSNPRRQKSEGAPRAESTREVRPAASREESARKDRPENPSRDSADRMKARQENPSAHGSRKPREKTGAREDEKKRSPHRNPNQGGRGERANRTDFSEQDTESSRKALSKGKTPEKTPPRAVTGRREKAGPFQQAKEVISLGQGMFAFQDEKGNHRGLLSVQTKTALDIPYRVTGVFRE